MSESENTERIVSRLGHAATNAAAETPLASRSLIRLHDVRSECLEIALREKDIAVVII